MVNPAARALRLNTVDLLRQPGAERSIDVTIEPSAVDVDDERIVGPLVVAALATSGVDSITVSGTITVNWHEPCRRCLRPIDGQSVGQIDELYQLDVSDPEAEQIEGDHIDLVPVVREITLLELPDGPLCEADCAGLCPACGANQNYGECGCDTAVRDERWAALDELQLDD